MSLFLLVTREGTGIMTSTKLAEMHELGKHVPFFVNKVSTYFCQKISTMNWQRIRNQDQRGLCRLHAWLSFSPHLGVPGGNILLLSRQIHVCAQPQIQSALQANPWGGEEEGANGKIMPPPPLCGHPLCLWDRLREGSLTKDTQFHKNKFTRQ